MKAEMDCTDRLYVCSSEKLKLMGSVTGFFPDTGHHVPSEMIGMWVHPIKLLDGFWLKLFDYDLNNGDGTWLRADKFINYPYGNEFLYYSGICRSSVKIRRFQFAPDEFKGCIVRYTFKNEKNSPAHLRLELLVRTDLQPVWFSDSIGEMDGQTDVIEYDEKYKAFHAKDCDHEWHCMFGADITPEEFGTGCLNGPENTSGKGVSGSLTYDIAIGPEDEKSIDFYFAGSGFSWEDCCDQYVGIQDPELFLDIKKERYEAIKHRSALIVDDSEFQDIFEWVKVDNDWLIQDVPGLGRGLTAGLPEYPWWFGCDSCYSLQGVLGIGDFELCRDTLLLILETSERQNGNGRIIHEVTTRGLVPNPGNTQETAQFITMVWKYYQWTGDWSLVERCIPYMSKSMDWLMAMDEDGDLFPSGYGIMEIEGLSMEMIDTAVYTCEAFAYWAEICRKKGWAEKSAEMLANFQKSKKAINKYFWNDEQKLFCDCISTFDKIGDHSDKLFELIPPHKKAGIEKYLKEKMKTNKGSQTSETGWILYENWVIATPMETGLADPKKARRALNRLYTDEFIGEFGAYLSGLLQNATMTISTGVHAVAQARYGFPERSLDLVKRMFKSFSMVTPGAISEMSPDYGCFVQAWTIYCAVVPVISCFFGIAPNAAEHCINLRPNMPKEWNKASLEAVRVMEGHISMSFSREKGLETYRISNHTGCELRIHNKKGYTMYIDGRYQDINEGVAVIPSCRSEISVIFMKDG